MRIRLFAALAALAVLALVRPTTAGELEPSAEDLFKWGEYDSLIRSLEPWLAARSAGADARADSLELARANLYLGIAYWATDKRSLGEQAFVRAGRLDRTLQMDRLYATPEMAARFDSIVAQERRARDAEIAAAATGKGNAGVPDRPGPAARKTGLGWKAWTVGALTTAGLVAGGTYVILANLKPEDEVMTVGPDKPPPE